MAKQKHPYNEAKSKFKKLSIPYTEYNHGKHWRFIHEGKSYNYWPASGKWSCDDTGDVHTNEAALWERLTPPPADPHFPCFMKAHGFALVEALHPTIPHAYKVRIEGLHFALIVPVALDLRISKYLTKGKQVYFYGSVQLLPGSMTPCIISTNIELI